MDRTFSLLDGEYTVSVFPVQLATLLAYGVLAVKQKIAYHYGDFCGRCVAGDISDPVKSIDEIEVETVANFCEIFAQVRKHLEMRKV